MGGPRWRQVVDPSQVSPGGLDVGLLERQDLGPPQLVLVRSPLGALSYFGALPNDGRWRQGRSPIARTT